MNPQQPSKAVPITIALIALIFILGVGMYFYSTNHSIQTTDDVSDVTNIPDTSVASSTDETPSTSGTVSETNIYFIALEDAGKTGKAVGCGDSVVPVKINLTPTQAPLRPTLEKLLAYKNEYYGESGLRNALSGSNLTVDSVAVANGIATVKLSGTVSLAGVCDDPRFVSQIKETVMQFPSVTSAVITINGKSLESYGSEK